MKNERGRELLLRAYIQLQVYNRVFSEWARIVYPPGYFCIGGTAVVWLYVALAHSGSVPGLLCAALAYLSAALVSCVFLLTSDTLKVTRESETVIMTLQTKTKSSRSESERMAQLVLLKRAKAIRPVAHPVGNFSSVTLGVLIVFVEEIINQLLFLLTL